MLILKAICDECYKKKYGKLPDEEYDALYRIRNKKIECEDCGKEDYLIFTTVSVNPKNYELKFK